MTPETLIQIQNIIEKFGFPVFVALCGLLLFAAVFRYMTKAIEKKDSDFKEYVEKRDARMAAFNQSANADEIFVAHIARCGYGHPKSSESSKTTAYLLPQELAIKINFVPF